MAGKGRLTLIAKADMLPHGKPDSSWVGKMMTNTFFMVIVRNIEHHPRPNSPEMILIKIHRTRKTPRNGIAGRCGSPGEVLVLVSQPRVV